MAETSITTFVRRIGHALFREDDEFAHLHEWQMQAGRLGLSRMCRCSGFELLTAVVRATARDDAAMLTAVSVLVPAARSSADSPVTGRR